MTIAFLLALLFSTQDFSHRGFLEGRLTGYPQKAPNDSARSVGEWLLRYEVFYTPPNSLQVAAAFDARTDTHHQVERELRLSWKDRERQRPAAAVRRLSAIYYNGPVTIEAGKQFIRWGKTDILVPTDRFAPRDFLTVVESEFLALPAARFTYEKGANTVDVVWAPRLTPSRIPLLGQRWTPLPEGVRIRDAGTNLPKGSQAGLRWNRTGAVDLSVSLYRGFNHLPSFEGTPRLIEGGDVQVDVRRFHPRMRMIGADMAVPLRWLTLKAEAGYFSSSDRQADAYLLYVVQLERQAGEWLIVGGYAGEVVTRDISPAGVGAFHPDRGLTDTWLGRAQYTIDASRNVAIEAALRQNGKGAWARMEYSRGYGQHWRVTAGFTLIRGETGDFLGQYRQNSNAAVVVRYNF